MNMKKLFPFMFLNLSQIIFCQVLETKYLMFDLVNNPNYTYETGSGKNVTRCRYVKEEKKNGVVVFFIENNRFVFTPLDSQTYCKRVKRQNVVFSDVDSLLTIVNKTNPFYPYKVFPNLYIVDSITDDEIMKYKVKWEYYIE